MEFKRYGKYVMVPYSEYQPESKTDAPETDAPKVETDAPLPKAEAGPDPVAEGDNNDRYLHIVPLKFRKRAAQLMDMLEKSGGRINEDFELVINGEKVQDSNILSLLRDAFTVKSLFQPRGMKEFYKYLKGIKLPPKLIVNKERKTLLSPIVKSKKKVVKKHKTVAKKIVHKWKSF